MNGWTLSEWECGEYSIFCLPPFLQWPAVTFVFLYAAVLGSFLLVVYAVVIFSFFHKRRSELF